MSNVKKKALAGCVMNKTLLQRIKQKIVFQHLFQKTFTQNLGAKRQTVCLLKTTALCNMKLTNAV